eukprot:SAG25_NODE_533_length_7143_cov_4.173623_8_plen_103_part_00
MILPCKKMAFVLFGVGRYGSRKLLVKSGDSCCMPDFQGLLGHSSNSGTHDALTRWPVVAASIVSRRSTPGPAQSPMVCSPRGPQTTGRACKILAADQLVPAS